MATAPVTLQQGEFDEAPAQQSAAAPVSLNAGEFEEAAPSTSAPAMPKNTALDQFQGQQKAQIAASPVLPTSPSSSPIPGFPAKAPQSPVNQAIEQTSGANYRMQSNAPAPTNIGEQVKSFQAGNHIVPVERDEVANLPAHEPVDMKESKLAPSTPGLDITGKNADAPLQMAIGAGKDLVTGGQEALSDIGEPFNKKQTIEGITKAINGGSKIGVALAAPELMELAASADAGNIAAQSAIVKLLATAEAGNAASDIGGRILDKKTNISPETKELVRTGLFFLPTLIGTTIARAGVRGGIGVDAEGNPAAGVSSPEGTVRAGVRGTPTAYEANVAVGSTRFGVKVPRSQPVPDAAQIQAGEQQAAATATAAKAAIIDKAAADKVAGVPPPPPPPQPAKPAGMDQATLTQATVQNAAEIIKALPAEKQAGAMLEAHGNLAKWMMNTGRFVGPDGKLQVADTPQKADKLAQDVLNAEVDRQTSAAEEKQKQVEAQAKQQEKQKVEAAKAAAEPNENGLTPQEQLGARVKTILEANPKMTSHAEQVATVAKHLAIDTPTASRLVSTAVATQQPTVGNGADATTEESKATVDAQVAALAKGDIHTVMLPEGSKYMPQVPKGAKVVKVTGDVPGAGTYITTLRAATVKEAAKAGTHGDLLGHIETKEDLADNKPQVVVQAKAPDGTVIQDSQVHNHPEMVGRQAEILHERHPEATISVAKPEDVIKERQATLETEAKEPAPVELQPNEFEEVGKPEEGPADEVANSERKGGRGQSPEPEAAVTSNVAAAPERVAPADYQAIQDHIDARESELEKEGHNLSKLYFSKRPDSKVLHDAPGWSAMPADLEALYDERDAIGEGHLKQSIADISTRLEKLGIRGAEARRVMDYYAIDPKNTGGTGQYMAAEHAQAMAKQPLKEQVESMYIRLAAERGIDIGTNDLRQGILRDEKTKRDATAAVKTMVSYLHGLPSDSAQLATQKPEKKTKYDFGSTQSNISEKSEAGKGLAAARSRIDEADLVPTEYGGNAKGLETEPHVTVRYGIQGDDTAGIEKYLRSQAPFDATLGKSSSFPPSKGSDGGTVIKADVEAPELHRMNAEIEKHGEFKESDFPEYKPHATIAYVKPEAVEKYVGMTETEGKKFRIDSVAVSDRNGNLKEIKLEGKSAAEPIKQGDAVNFKDRKGTERTGRVIYAHDRIVRIKDTDGKEVTVPAKNVAKASNEVAEKEVADANNGKPAGGVQEGTSPAESSTEGNERRSSDATIEESKGERDSGTDDTVKSPKVVDISSAQKSPATAKPQPDVTDEFMRATELEGSQATLPQAKKLYEEILEKIPDHVESLINLGSIYHREGEYRQAEKFFRKAIDADPEYPMAYFNLGTVLDELRHRTEAISSYEHAIKLDPQFADAHYNLALALEHKGDHRRALPHWQRYAKLDPAGPWNGHAKTRVKKILANEGLSIIARTDKRPTLRASLFGVDILAKFMADTGLKFYQKDIQPSLEKLGPTAVNASRQVTDILYPRIGANEDALDSLMKAKGDREAYRVSLENIDKGLDAFFDKMPLEAQIAFMDRAKLGVSQLGKDKEQTQKLDEIRVLMEDLNAESTRRMLKYKPNMALRDHYYGMIWKTIPDANGKHAASNAARAKNGFTGQGKRPFEGAKGFMKQSTLENITEGINMGGEPITHNPWKMFRLVEAQKMQYITAQDHWKRLKELGLRKFVGHGEKKPEGWAPLDDRLAKTFFPASSGEGMVHAGDWYLEHSAALLLNNYLSRDLIRENAIGNALMLAKNLATGLELSLSPFHLMFESLEAMGSQLGLGVQRFWNTGVREGSATEAAKGLGDAAGFMAAPFLIARSGGSMMKMIQSPQDFANTKRGLAFLKKYPNAPALLADLYSGGLTWGMNEDYRTDPIKSLRESAKEGNYVGTVLRALPALNQTIMHPLFGVLIPRLKWGLALAQLSQQYAEEAEALANGDTTREKVARQVVDTVENRLGELNFSNLFWNNTFKSIMQFIFRSVTWKLGNWRGLGSALGPEAKAAFVDPLKAMYEDVRGGKKTHQTKDYIPRMGPNQAWLFGMIAMTTMLGTIFAKLVSSKYPWEHAEEDARAGYNAAEAWLLESIHPRTGKVNKFTGKPERVSLPTGIKDFEHAERSPKAYVNSSLSSTVGRFTDIAVNRDFFGNYVYDPNGPYYKKAAEIFSYAVPRPIGLENWNSEFGSQDIESKAMRFAGFNASSSQGLDNSPAEQRMVDLAKSAHTPETPEQVKAYRERDNNAKPTVAQMRSIIKHGNKEHIVSQFEKMGYADARDIYNNYAMPREKAILKDILNAKRLRALKKDVKQGTDKVAQADAN